MKMVQLFQLHCSYILPIQKKPWTRNSNWNKWWPLPTVWRLWCMIKNSHLCIQVSIVMNWWFLDWIILSLAQSNTHTFTLTHSRTPIVKAAAATTTVTDCRKTKCYTMISNIWFVTIFHLQTQHIHLFIIISHHIEINAHHKRFHFLLVWLSHNCCDKNSPRNHFAFHHAFWIINNVNFVCTIPSICIRFNLNCDVSIERNLMNTHRHELGCILGRGERSYLK